jgi:hypothetical protein
MITIKTGRFVKIKVLGIKKTDDETTTIKRDAAMMTNFKNYISKLNYKWKILRTFGVFTRYKARLPLVQTICNTIKRR